MSYTPKEWVCGETITADGLNNIEEGVQEALECCGSGDCGYSCETTSTVLTEETVTTSGSAPYITADLSYSTPIDAGSLTATFEGADYELDKVDLGWGIAYGDWQNAPDFTNYPLAILSSNGMNTIFTETAGTYSVKLVANQEDISTSECFEKAVKLFGLKYVADAEIKGGVLANDVNGNTVTAQFALAEGSGTTASGDYSHAEGFNNTTASGSASHAEGNGTTASGSASHAEGGGTTASGFYSHAEGFEATASGDYSHAEGWTSEASGECSHSEGHNTTASGTGSHTEGLDTVASGNHSHAEGEYTTASGDKSYASGYKTIAKHRCQHAFGEWNVADPSSSATNARGTYIEIVGNGTQNDRRSNARTLDWNGNEVLQGSLTLGQGTADETTITAAQLKALLASL